MDTRRSSNLRFTGGVGGIAEAQTTTGGAAGASAVNGSGWFNPQAAHFWVMVLYGGAWAWLLWLRFIYRGAAL